MEIELSQRKRCVLSRLFTSLAVLLACAVVYKIQQEQERANEARFRETMLDSTLAKADLAIIILDEEGHIAYVSPGVEALTGYTPNEIKEMKVEDLMPAASREAHTAGVKRLLEGFPPTKHRVDCAIITKSGKLQPVTNYVYGHDSGGIAVLIPAPTS